MSASLYKDRYRVKYSFDQDGNAIIDCVVEYLDDQGNILNPPITWQGVDIDAVISTMNECCKPYFRSFKASEIPVDLEGFNVVSFYSTSSHCTACDIDIEISCGGESVGTISVPSSVGEFCPLRFDCLLDGVSIANASSLDDNCLTNLYIYVQRTQ